MRQHQYNQGPWVAAKKAHRKEVLHKSKDKTSLTDYGKSIVISRWVNAWMWFLYFSFQIHFAILCAIGLSASLAADAILASMQEGTFLEQTTYSVIVGVDRVLETTSISGISELVFRYVLGVEFDPFYIFIVALALILLLVGVLHFMIIWFLFAVNGIHSLSGKHGGRKKFYALLFIVGSFLPFLNLFPVFKLWTGIVTRNPK